jgi:hypothetical protein
MNEDMKMNDEQELTPALLRADAASVRGLGDWFRDSGFQESPRKYYRAAAALEEQAARLEQGERVCRWAWDDELIGYSVSCHFRIVNGQPPRCPDCGGRVVLGDGEAGR